MKTARAGNAKSFFLSLMFTVLLIGAALSAEFKSGEPIHTSALCMSEEAARDLSGRIAEGGRDAYLNGLTRDTTLDCFYLPDLGVPPMNGVIIEEAWRVTSLEGTNLIFYKVLAQDGSTIWTWTVADTQPETQERLGAPA